MNDRISPFRDWFIGQALRLRLLPLEEAGDEILAELRSVDPGLYLELADHAQNRELVVTVDGNTGLFEVVRSIKASLGQVPSWIITALKPARGFRFVLSTPEGGSVEASELFFEPLETVESSPRLGIRVFLPSEMVTYPDIKWLLRIAVGTGIGEELAAQIAFLEAAPTAATPDDALPIEALGDFVLHFHKVNRH